MLAALLVVVACKKGGEVEIEQYNEADAPVVGQGVRLYLGDVSLGKDAPVRVVGPHGETIASGHLGIGDDLPFWFDGKFYAVIAVSFDDHIVGDTGVLRVERRRPPSGDPVVRIVENTSAPLPGLDGMSLAVDTIVDHHRADIRVLDETRGAVVSQTVRAGEVISIEHRQTPYRLTVLAFKGHTHTHDWALVRIGR